MADTYSIVSVRLSISISKSIHKQLRAWAVAEGRSTGSLASFLVEREVRRLTRDSLGHELFGHELPDQDAAADEGDDDACEEAA